MHQLRTPFAGLLPSEPPRGTSLVHPKPLSFLPPSFSSLIRTIPKVAASLIRVLQKALSDRHFSTASVILQNAIGNRNQISTNTRHFSGKHSKQQIIPADPLNRCSRRSQVNERKLIIPKTSKDNAITAVRVTLFIV